MALGMEGIGTNEKKICSGRYRGWFLLAADRPFLSRKKYHLSLILLLPWLSCTVRPPSDAYLVIKVVKLEPLRT